MARCCPKSKKPLLFMRLDLTALVPAGCSPVGRASGHGPWGLSSLGDRAGFLQASRRGRKGSRSQRWRPWDTATSASSGSLPPSPTSVDGLASHFIKGELEVFLLSTSHSSVVLWGKSYMLGVNGKGDAHCQSHDVLGRANGALTENWRRAAKLDK